MTLQLPVIGRSLIYVEWNILLSAIIREEGVRVVDLILQLIKYTIFKLKIVFI